MDALRHRQPALVVALLLAGVASGCGASAPSGATPTAAHAAAAREPLPFLHDDFPRALAEAKRTKRPIFVDAWAEWCHSCQSMRAFVLTDPLLAPLANDFVWLTVDTEKDANAGFVAKYTNRVYPTLWVIDPASGEPSMRWEGTATARELVALLSASKASDAAGLAFVRGNHEAAKGDLVEAERAYREVLAAPASHPQRARAVEALVGLLDAKKAYEACATVASDEHAKLPKGTSRATVLVTGLGCAEEAKDSARLATLEAAALAAATDAEPAVLADDRSALFEALVDRHEKAKDEAGAKRVAAQWASFLEGEAKKAPTSLARAVFDAHRVGAYIALGEPLRAVPMLEASQRDFPEDYNPPARLARVYLEAKDLDRARAAIDRAAAKVYGPRSLRVAALAADIAKARGDAAGETRALERGLDQAAGAVLNTSQKALRDKLSERLSQLRGTPEKR